MFILTIGYPGSGKSIWAKYHVENNNKSVIINRDSIRTMIAGTYQNYEFC